MDWNDAERRVDFTIGKFLAGYATNRREDRWETWVKKLHPHGGTVDVFLGTFLNAQDALDAIERETVR